MSELTPQEEFHRYWDGLGVNRIPTHLGTWLAAWSAAQQAQRDLDCDIAAATWEEAVEVVRNLKTGGHYVDEDGWVADALRRRAQERTDG